ncbi:hypothetical protein [Roseicyclus mahoneyensis]|uniref:DUF1127 domain-containing protein n=1 Tax=Roseicyclus mahoneyensis TaxID=164332 RepID=A0A316G6B5_9RHOB|nr:hypothetical protein [Roseicyclus mahoneyensis]PWK55330.1 hypothetical protein C7455_11821 [Roseicyclus mahoneyensis]
MTTQTLNSPAFPPRIVSQVAGFFAALARAFAQASDAQARFDEIQMLQSLSDAELAKRGLTRDTIVRHVYADMLAD